MNESDLKAIESKRYNQWCEKRPLVSKGNDYLTASTFLAKSELTPYEKAAFYFHNLTGCAGFEFVIFSNAKFSKPITLPNQIIFVPCFLVSLVGRSMTDPVLHATLKMQKQARFVYDGWIPIDSWDESNIRNTIRAIDEALSIFSLQGSILIEWEPKYHATRDRKSSYDIDDEYISGVEKLSDKISELNGEDRIALYRSLGWFSQGLRLSEPAARFLFFMLTIESLATYIERNSNNESILRQKLANTRLSKGERKAIREKCIHEILSSCLSENPTKAVQEAYFNCVTGIRKLLMGHIDHVSKSNKEAMQLLFEPKEGSLYELRNKIAHGGADALSEIERDRIRRRLWEAEQTTRRYLLTVISDALEVKLEQNSISASLFIGPGDMVPSNGRMHKGPKHMSIIYAL